LWCRYRGEWRLECSRAHADVCAGPTH
jgi:hypothetical protein